MYRCPRCSRPNPDKAQFCYFDGQMLDPAAASRQVGRFGQPFVFHSGRECWSFDDLALGCQQFWSEALDLLRSGGLATFLAGQGRMDLAAAARAAAAEPDLERGLDQLLRLLPARTFEPARLRVQPGPVDLGVLPVGQDQTHSLRLFNEGMGLLHGTITSDAPWLAVGDGEGGGTRLFSCLDDVSIPLHVRGRALRAGVQPLVGRLLIQSSGGNARIEVHLSVPPVPFHDGVLAGSVTPRQLAERARAAPQEAAVWFQNGAVVRWYETNGWTYPVQEPAASGVAAVQQYFEALGVATPPRVSISANDLRLHGRAGDTVRASVTVSTPERKPVFAHATSDQPWLAVHDVQMEGRTATIHLQVSRVPDYGASHSAHLTVLSNGRQRFVVPVLLDVSGTGEPAAAPPPPRPFTPPPVPRWQPAPAEGGRPARKSSRWPLVVAPLAFLLLIGAVGALAVLNLDRDGRGQTKVEPEDRGSGGGSKDLTPGSAVKKTFPPRPGPRRPAEKEYPGAAEIPGLRKPPPASPEILLPELPTRHVEVVFCLDTTGSMGGLLTGAKAKIWSICNQIAGGSPTPQLKVGLIGYRDKGDDYVTRVVDLDADLDSIHTQLHEFQASGGGDFAEHVNQALHEAVNKIKWSPDKNTLKIVFLVGDAPPHLDYLDDVKYPETCKRAAEKGILINTIQCGNDGDCRKAWQDIAAKGSGETAAIPSAGGVSLVTTPLDTQLIAKGSELWDTALIYGDAAKKRRGEEMLSVAKKLRGPSGADRVAFAAKSRRVNPYDLIDAIKTRKVSLEDVKEEHLPAALAELKTQADREAELSRLDARRKRLYEEILALEKKRAALINAEVDRTKGGNRDAFDTQVLQMLRKQAKRADISY